MILTRSSSKSGRSRFDDRIAPQSNWPYQHCENPIRLVWRIKCITRHNPSGTVRILCQHKMHVHVCTPIMYLYNILTESDRLHLVMHKTCLFRLKELNQLISESSGQLKGAEKGQFLLRQPPQKKSKRYSRPKLRGRTACINRHMRCKAVQHDPDPHSSDNLRCLSYGVYFRKL